MQAYSALQTGFLSATLEIQIEFPWGKLSFTLTVHSQYFLQYYSISDYLLNSKRDLSCVNNNNIHFHYCNLKLDCLPCLSALREALQNDLVFLQAYTNNDVQHVELVLKVSFP